MAENRDHEKEGWAEAHPYRRPGCSREGARGPSGEGVGLRCLGFVCISTPFMVRLLRDSPSRHESSATQQHGVLQQVFDVLLTIPRTPVRGGLSSQGGCHGYACLTGGVAARSAARLRRCPEMEMIVRTGVQESLRILRGRDGGSKMMARQRPLAGSFRRTARRECREESGSSQPKRPLEL